jgi:tRNA (uracil-5-)-methyltransferase TRM9
LIYVWAFEQGENSKRKMGVLAEPGEPTGEQGEMEAELGGTETSAQGTGADVGEGKDTVKAQDVMVPWVLQPKPVPKTARQPRKAERRRRLQDGGNTSVDASRTTEGAESIESIESTAPQPTEPTQQAQPEPQVFHRYYHLFIHGELRALVEHAAREEGFDLVGEVPVEASEIGSGHGGRQGNGKWARVVAEGYEKDNWWLEGEVGLY